MVRIFFALAAVCLFSQFAAAHAEGLESYVASLGPPSVIKVIDSTASGPTRVAFQSQEWRGISWTHELLIKNPAILSRRDVVLVLLTGGEGGSDQQRSAEKLADALGVRAVVLTRVPNQPLYDGKKEDVLLSFSLDQYRLSGDASWPLLFPMVSSVVKGIDTLEQVLGEQRLKVVLIGASKRGWTTYLTAAVDSRIAAMVPTVFEMVSMQAQIALMRERYGRDSEKIRPYTALGLTDSLREPRVAQLISWIDPIEYFPRYTMPKLVLLGANDPYWVVDSVRRYWDALPEPKMLRILPNVGHGVLGEAAAGEAIVSFVRTVVDGQPIPQVAWRYSSSANGRAVVSGQGREPLSRCSLWRATSSTPDFREARFSPLECRVVDGGKRFTGSIEAAPHEYTAVFGDLEISTSRGGKIVVSTESQVYSRGMR
jgi:PhoPQ-activated pathogenicity-related protein